MKRYLLIIAGSFAVMLGVIGIFLPLLPTTPWLLLAAVCYARSSEKFYNWLLNTKWLGSYIRNYLEDKVIQLKVKIASISFLWVTIGYSAFFILNSIYLRVLMLAIASAVTIHILHLPRTVGQFSKKLLPCLDRKKYDEVMIQEGFNQSAVK